MTSDAETAEPRPGSEEAAASDIPEEITGAGLAIRKAMMAAAQVVAAYTRLEFEAPEEIVPPPALVVANHGFGGIFDLNVFALAETFRQMGYDADNPAIMLTHEMAWKTGVGKYLEQGGFVRANRTNALAGLGCGRYVFVLPGGDVDASKTWRHRHEILFDGRTGFAKLAMDAGVPIVPVVVVGAGESLFVLSDGQRLARALRLDKIMRLKAAPVTLSLPWGLSIGTAALVPYFPLPTKLKVAFCDPVEAVPGEDAASLAGRVHDAMSAKAAELSRGRIPILGWQLPVDDGDAGITE